MRTAVCLCSVLAALCVPAGSAWSGKELTHTLRDGERIEQLARHYYGSGWKAAYILGRNKIGVAKDIQPGKRLVIPSSWIYKVRRGDSLARIAKRYLGSTDRYKILARHNGIKEGQELDAGAELLLPFHITYTVAAGDSFSAISKRYYRNTRMAGTLRDYNGGTAELHPGDKLVVPIFDRATLDVRSKGPPPAPKGTGKPPSKTQSTRIAHKEPAAAAANKQFDDAALKTAVGTYLAGDFGDAADELSDLLDAELPPKPRATILKYLAFCAVAHGDNDDAGDYFRLWLAIEPKASLDPTRTSPKILEVFDAVVTEVRGAGK